MARVFWDTNILIYLVEEYPLWQEVAALRERMLERGDTLLLSAFTVGELLVKPIGEGDDELAQTYEALLSHPLIEVISFDLACAPIYARIRATQRVKPPDAIQLACAASGKADLFITNDIPVTRLRIPEIPFITTVERAPI